MAKASDWEDLGEVEDAAPAAVRHGKGWEDLGSEDLAPTKGPSARRGTVPSGAAEHGIPAVSDDGPGEAPSYLDRMLTQGSGSSLTGAGARLTEEQVIDAISGSVTGAKRTPGATKEMIQGSRERYNEQLADQQLDEGLRREDPASFRAYNRASLASRRAAREAAVSAGAARDEQALFQPSEYAGDLERAFANAVPSVAQSLAVAVPAAMLGPEFAAPVAALTLGTGAGGARYSQLREMGFDKDTAARSAAITTAIEAGTEMLPMGTLVKRAPGLAKKFGEFFLEEQLGENIATSAELVLDLWDGLRDNVTKQDFLDAIAETTAATAVSAGMQMGSMELVSRIRDLANRKAQERAPLEQPAAPTFEQPSVDLGAPAPEAPPTVNSAEANPRHQWEDLGQSDISADVAFGAAEPDPDATEEIPVTEGVDASPSPADTASTPVAPAEAEPGPEAAAVPAPAEPAQEFSPARPRQSAAEEPAPQEGAQAEAGASDLGGGTEDAESVSSVGAPVEGQPEPRQRKPRAPRQKKPVEEPDPFDPEVIALNEDLNEIESRIGWGYKGGHPTIDPAAIAGARNFAEADRMRGQQSRTEWDAAHPLWKDRPVNISEADAVEAIRRARAGEKLSPKMQQFIDWGRGVVQDERDYHARVPNEADRITPDDLKEALLEPGDLPLAQILQQARTIGVDEDDIDGALEAPDDESAIGRLKELIRGHEEAQSREAHPAGAGEAEGRAAAAPAREEVDAGPAGAAAPDPGELSLSGDAPEGSVAGVGELRDAVRSETPRATDLFGADSERQDALTSENARIERKLGRGRDRAPPPPGGMFAAADAAERARLAANQTSLVEGGDDGLRPTSPAGPVASVAADQPGRAAETSPVDEAAHAAATSPHNDLPEPSHAQIEAGNYQKGHHRVHGLDISIENPKGSVRRSKPGARTPWEVTMPAHYGYIRGTKGADGEHVDVTLGPNADSPVHDDVFVIDQQRADGKGFDEHKAFIGFGTPTAAHDAYLASFADRELAERLSAGGVARLSVENFRNWLETGDTTQPIAGAVTHVELGETRKGWKGVPVASIDTQQIAGRWYYGASLNHSMGGFASPLSGDGEGFATQREAIDAARARILKAARGTSVEDRVTKWLNVQGPTPTAAIPDTPPRAKKPRSQPVAESEKPRLQPVVSKNTVFTEDRAAKARAILKAKLGQANAGLDPELMTAGMELAGYHIEKGARTFAAYAKAMIDDLGEAVRPYLRSWYEALRYHPESEGFRAEMSDSAEIDAAPPVATAAPAEQDEKHAERQRSGVESDLPDGDLLGLGSEVSRPESGRDDAGDAAERAGAGVEGDRPSGDQRVSGAGTLGSGAHSDQPVRAATPGNPRLHPGDDFGQGGLDFRDPGALSGHLPAATVEGSATRAVTREEKLAAQRAAEKIPTAPGLENIKATLPFLNEGQHEDVHNAETRFAKATGVLFTNGTGTGKTYLGLGVVKRFARDGKANILITVPNDKIASDWIRSGKDLLLDITRLEDTRSSGKGIVITTYANAGENQTLADRDWDLILPDESHYLSANAQGELTGTGRLVKMLSLHPEWLRSRATMRNRKLWDKVRSLSDRREALEREGRRTESYALYDNELRPATMAAEAADAAEVKRLKSLPRPKVMMLSATPFAYDLSVDYAEGLLFDYPKSEGYAGYNIAQGRNAFFVQHFGYSMRTNKLTKPDSEVNSQAMEVNFNAMLKREGALFSRMLNVDADYERKFVTIAGRMGAAIDEGIEWLWGWERRNGKYRPLARMLKDTFTHHNRLYTLEAIKATGFIPIIQQSLAAGRKVLVIHDFKKGGAFHPFRFPKSGEEVSTTGDDGKVARVKLSKLVEEFEAERPDLVGLDFEGLGSPIVTLTKAFPGALLFNGDIPAKVRRQNVDMFNDDGGAHNILIAQADAAREGISLHDTSGRFMRVEINLGLPTKPTAAIQLEGRVYRTGQVSDALFLYGNTGTNFERNAFAVAIAERASTAENLAMGVDARGLKQAFVTAFEGSTDGYVPSAEDGKGGKAFDRSFVTALTPFEQAKTYYFAQQKKNSRTKAREGLDYFATPEPLGLKMVEFAQIRKGMDVLEPSAGHGAIARWFPEDTHNTMVEQSSELVSRAQLAAPKARIVTGNFEDLHISNKYDAIVMNPPFGTAGRLAVDHVMKAATHLREGGRIVAILPTSADAKLAKWMESEDAKDIYMSMSILLPSVTFERAGTGVIARVVILDKTSNPDLAPYMHRLDLSNTDSIGEFFDRIEYIDEIPPRVAVAAAPVAKPGPQVTNAPVQAPTPVPTEKFTSHSYVTNAGGTRYIARPTAFLGDDFGKYSELARAQKGFWSSFGKKENHGFQFKTEAARDAFLLAAGQDPGRLDLTPVDTVAPGTALPSMTVAAHVAKIFERSAIRAVPIDMAAVPEACRERIASLDADRQKRWRGWAFTDVDGTPTVLLRTDAFQSIADLERTALHEAAHHGFAATLGEQFDAYAANIFRLYGRETFEEQIRDYYGEAFDPKNPAHVSEVVEEFMADQAQEATSSRFQRMLDDFIQFLQRALRSMGWKATFAKSEMRDVIRRSVRAALTDELPANRIEQNLGFSLDEMEQQTEASQNWFREQIAQGQPIDRIFRAAFSPFGLATIRDGKWYVNPAIKSVAVRTAEQLGRAGTQSFTWTRPLFQRAQAHVLDTYGIKLDPAQRLRTIADNVRYGLGDRLDTPPEFIAREQDKETEVRKGLRAALELGEQLMHADMSQAETQLLTAALEGKEIDDEAIKRVAAPIIDAIDDMGRQLVSVGILKREDFERNRKKYYHRTYLRREQPGWFADKAEGYLDRRRVRLQGDIFKGRGIFQQVSLTDLKKAVPSEYWGARFEARKIDVALANTKWVMLDKVAAQNDPAQLEALPGARQGQRVLQRLYVPVEAAGHPKYAAYVNRGTFEVRSVSPGKVTLWRDFSEEERARMGQILDGRYNAVKTYSMMVKDLATGRFYQDIAQNPDWARDAEPLKEDGTPDWVPAKEMDLRKWTAYGTGWVLVPDTKIPKSQTLRYGALAGKYVRAAIWRDMAELHHVSLPGTWKSILRVWKRNKTARSPVTHMNNIMSNFLLMDMLDVRGTDFRDGVMSYFRKDAHYEDARDHGLFGGTELDREIKEKILDKILRELKEEAGPQARINWVGKLWSIIRSVDESASTLYQLEDELFRMAAYMKHRADGRSAREAVALARRQFIDPDIRAPWVNAARETVLPFIGYTYRAIPLLAETVYHRPWKVAKYAAIAYAVNSFGYWATGDDEDDEEEERRLMQEQYQGHTWLGTDRMIRWWRKDKYGNPVYLDVRRWIPGGDVFDMQGTTVEWMPAWIQIGGPLVIAMEAAFGYNSFKDERIWNKHTDEGLEVAAKIGGHVWQGFMPNAPWIPGSYSVENLARAGRGDVKGTTQDRTLSNEIFGAFGWKFRSQNTELNREHRQLDFEMFERQVSIEESRLRRQRRDGKISKDEMDEGLERLREKLRKAKEKRDAILNGPAG